MGRTRKQRKASDNSNLLINLVKLETKLLVLIRKTCFGSPFYKAGLNWAIKSLIIKNKFGEEDGKCAS
jgi:hypothetical protein